MNKDTMTLLPHGPFDWHTRVKAYVFRATDAFIAFKQGKRTDFEVVRELLVNARQGICAHREINSDRVDQFVLMCEDMLVDQIAMIDRFISKGGILSEMNDDDDDSLDSNADL